MNTQAKNQTKNIKCKKINGRKKRTTTEYKKNISLSDFMIDYSLGPENYF
jgi:hypothetical protein